MKFQLDTKDKTIKVEGTVNLEELFEVLKKILPNGEWKQFSLESNTTITWVNPITIPYYPYYPPLPYPWWQPSITYSSDGIGTTLDITPTSYSLGEGTYCVQTG